MEIKELRIGNFINFKNREDIDYCEVTALAQEGYVHVSRYFKDGLHNDDQPENISDCTPIPLTIHWLLRFGFMEEIGNGHYWHLDGFKLWMSGSPSDYHYYHINSELLFHVDYVHQLQNIIFSLTGEELKIKQ